MSAKSNKDLEQAVGCSCMMALGVPLAMVIMGVESDVLWPISIILVIVAVGLFIAFVASDKPSTPSPKPNIVDHVTSRQMGIGSTDDFADLDEDVREGAARFFEQSGRTDFRILVDDDDFQQLKHSLMRLLRLLQSISFDKRIREKVLDQAHDRDTIKGEFDHKSFFTTLELLLAKDVVYIFERFGLSTNMNFTTAAGQLLLAITILLNEGLKSKCSYEEFMRELSYDNEYCNQLRGVHEEMWLVYRDSNVNVKSEDLDDLGLMLILELVARDANYIMDMRSLLNQLAEAIAQIVGNNEVITSALDELRGRVERDKQIIAELEGEQNTMKREPTGTIADLDQLVGLSLVKSEVTALKRFVEVNKRRQEMGMKTPTISYHCVFTGNPGTGKTTVARIVAGIYKDLGILSKGHLVETDRSGLVAEYVGQTAVKTNKIIDSALDGVLFVDEAYSLVAGGKEDYGKEAIATLLKRMEDDRDRLVVILAGYEDEMKQFVDSNPGLRSRFNRYIHFEDYSADELMQIFSNQLRAFDYTIDSRAETVLQQHLEQCVAIRGKDFGNARYVRNLFERTIEAQAVRLSSLAEPDSEALSRITEHDVTTALNRMSHQ